MYRLAPTHRLDAFALPAKGGHDGVIAERRQERAQQIVRSRGYTSGKDAARPARTKCRLKSHLASERLDGGADTANAPL